MRNWLKGLLVILLLWPLLAPGSPQGGESPTPVAVPALDHETITLNNGLRAIIHTDRTSPLVAISVLYGVGARHELPQQSGFAHLLEHLLFTVTGEGADSFTQRLEAAGAYDVNAVTSYDYTRFFATVPTASLELALALEADRITHFRQRLSSQALDRQLAIVQAEARERASRPDAEVNRRVREALLPPDLGYRHDLIGDTQTLADTDPEQIRAWHRDYYGPENIVLVLAGDIDVGRARALLDQFFSPIERGAGIPAAIADVPAPGKLQTETLSLVSNDGSTAIQRVWMGPGQDHDDTAALDMAMGVLGGPLRSHLDRVLVREERLASRTSAGIEAYAGVSLITVRAELLPGVPTATLERRLDQLLEEYFRTGPSADEIEAVAARDVLWSVAGMEWLGGYVGKAAILGEGLLSAGDPLRYRERVAQRQLQTPETALKALSRWCSVQPLQVRITPADVGHPLQQATPALPIKPDRARPGPVELTVPGEAATYRTDFPAPGPQAPVRFPQIETTVLDNGIRVYLVRRDQVPTVRLNFMLDSGLAAEPPGQRGILELSQSMLVEGTERFNAEQLATQQNRLGSVIAASSGQDRSSLSLQGLHSRLPDAVALLSQMLTAPVFPPEALERVRSRHLQRIDEERRHPDAIAARAIPHLLYGPQHPYGGSDYGLGNREVVSKLGRVDLQAFHAHSFSPETTRVFAVGNTHLSELKNILEQEFGDWRKIEASPAVHVAPPVPVPVPTAGIKLVDLPNSAQAYVYGAIAFPALQQPQATAFELGVHILGERLNRLLREQAGIAYGVQTSYRRAVHAGRLDIRTQLTADAMAQFMPELRNVVKEWQRDGVTASELNRESEVFVQRHAASLESSVSLMGHLQRLALDSDTIEDFDRRQASLRELTAADVNTAIQKAAGGDEPVWLVVGDRRTVLPQLQTGESNAETLDWDSLL